MRSIRSKLLASFLAIIMLPLLTLGILTPIIYSRTIERETTSHTVQMLHQVTRNLEFYIHDMENIVFYLSSDPKIRGFLDAGRPVPAAMYDHAGASAVLTTYTSAHPEIAGILVVNGSDQILSNEFDRIARDPMADESWYQQAVLHPETVQLYPKPIGRNLRNNLEYSAEEVVSVVKAVADPQTGRPHGVILIDMKMKVVEEIFTNTTLGDTGFIFIVDEQGNTVYVPVNRVVYRVRFDWLTGRKPSMVKEIQGAEYQIIYEDSPYTRWKTVGVFSLNEILRQVSEIRYYSMIIAGVTVLMAFIASVFFATSIARPVIQLKELMKRVEGGDLAIRFRGRVNDEIGQLGNSFNTMIGEIRKLIDLVYHEQQSKREAELKILQQQIKPHFLYNTLDTIQWMAQDRGAADIVTLVGALTSLFRIGLSRGKEMIPLEEEIEHVRSYLVIQKARYEDKFDYSISVEEGLAECRVLKLTLQPLVENAIYHGIKQRRGHGFITVTAERSGDALLLKVADDGVGMTEERVGTLQRMLSRHQGQAFRTVPGPGVEATQPPGETAAEAIETDGGNGTGGYAIFNVNERIHLSFGTRFGIRIESRYGSGTTVEVVHPLIYSEVTEHVEGPDRG
ncbi:cache domain-containing sensor histidine kinase [Salinispira pacifica]